MGPESGTFTNHHRAENVRINRHTNDRVMGTYIQTKTASIPRDIYALVQEPSYRTTKDMYHLRVVITIHNLFHILLALGLL